MKRSIFLAIAIGIFALGSSAQQSKTPGFGNFPNGISGTENDDDPQCEGDTYYFEWRDNRLRLIKLVMAGN